MAVITLTTDFGLDDEFVGVMKGVILTINPDVRVVDITHGIDPQDLTTAAYSIHAAYPYFPEGTVHVVVVDPGVGSSRAIVAASLNGHYFVAPDNGVLSLVLDAPAIDRIVQVTNAQYILKPVSRTFHGRDIMAPVAGHLSRGIQIDRLGPRLRSENLARLPIEAATTMADGTVAGKVIMIDRFGNLITNIDTAALDPLEADFTTLKIEFGIEKQRIQGLSASYSDVPPNVPLAIIGSKGLVEIAINCGCAQDYFNARKGDVVYIS